MKRIVCLLAVLLIALAAPGCTKSITVDVTAFRGEGPVATWPSVEYHLTLRPLYAGGEYGDEALLHFKREPVIVSEDAGRNRFVPVRPRQMDDPPPCFPTERNKHDLVAIRVIQGSKVMRENANGSIETRLIRAFDLPVDKSRTAPRRLTGVPKGGESSSIFDSTALFRMKRSTKSCP